MHSIEATTRKAAIISERFVAAAKPIESALRNFNDRIAELEIRTHKGDALLSSLESPLREHEQSAKEHAHTIERTNVRLTEVDQRLRTVADELSSLKHIIEGIAAQNKGRSEELGRIKATVTAVQDQVASLSQRFEPAERGHNELSRLSKSLVTSLAELTAFSQETAQQLSDLRKRIQLTLIEPEAQIGSTSVRQTQHSKAETEDGSPGACNQNTLNETVSSGETGPPKLADTPPTFPTNKQEQRTISVRDRHIASEGRGEGSREEREPRIRPGEPVESATQVSSEEEMLDHLLRNITQLASM
jgi:chromosome segregation ATPase